MAHDFLQATGAARAAHLAMRGVPGDPVGGGSVREVMGRVDPAPSDRPQTHSADDPRPRPAPPTGHPRGAHTERDPKTARTPPWASSGAPCRPMAHCGLSQDPCGAQPAAASGQPAATHLPPRPAPTARTPAPSCTPPPPAPVSPSCTLSSACTDPPRTPRGSGRPLGTVAAHPCARL